ncbi:2-nitropropane dioxygenase [Histoplasma capsulatum var. duboisii H88]|uniref:2-nitropropane dioxygenase n=1 Tax=Ajellomyces capsulatus (strain H88) TaxID=544711 RepID=A0A8A1L7K2_AJEC8|nr:2-nitropropane dioxygenase [Histoplasma capsulatum var. duboisii H88]
MPTLHALHRTLPASAPAIISAPMLAIASPNLAVSVTRAGGLGFIGAGFDVSSLETLLSQAAELVSKPSSPPIPNYTYNKDDDDDTSSSPLPIGIGLLNWGADLDLALPVLAKQPPAALWLFAARDPDPASTFAAWAREVRRATHNRTRIWIQIGSVAEALEAAARAQPDVLVVQGSDAGGHGLARSASIVSLVPEVKDALVRAGHGGIPLVAAGGIADGRGVAAALCLGAQGVVMGTRFLASAEATVSRGYQAEVLRVADGGVSTVRTTVYDAVRGYNAWPAQYDGRGVVNETLRDKEAGMDDAENQRLYKEEMAKGDAGWGPTGRMTTYAGTGIGLVREVKSAEEIVRGVVAEAKEILEEVKGRLWGGLDEK